MNLQQLRYVVATVDHQTMTAAADALHVSQPALTRAIRALERELGTALFLRDGRRVLPTSAGLTVVEYARRALQEIDRLRVATAREPMTIAATPTLGAYLLPTLVRSLLARRPEVTIRLRHLPSPEEVASEVEAGRATIGLVDLPVPGNLAITPVAEREVVLLCPRGSPAHSPISLPELEKLQFIVPSAGSRRRSQVDALFGKFGTSPTVVCETDDRGTWSTLIAAGVGHALMARPQAERADPQLTRIVTFTPPIHQTIALIYRPDRLTRPAADLLAAATCGIVRQ